MRFNVRTGHMREMVRLKEMRVKGWNDLVALRRRSLIVNAADATLLVRRSKGENDFYFVAAEDPETAVSRIVELVKTRIPGRFGLDPVRDIQVLCPMNRGGAGARSLNIELQAALNPTGERKVERFGWTFAPGDKVMQIENDYDKEVYNGDIGQVTDVDPEAGELTARFEGRDLLYGFGELDALVPAYAATVLKSQGCQRRRKNVPARRRKSVPRARWQLVPVVHGRDPRAGRCALRAAGGGPRVGGACGPTGSSGGLFGRLPAS